MELFLKKVHVAVDVGCGELVYHHLWCQLVESLVLQFTRGQRKSAVRLEKREATGKEAEKM